MTQDKIYDDMRIKWVCVSQSKVNGHHRELILPLYSVYPVPTVRPSFNVWPLPLGHASYIIIDWFKSGWAMPAHHVLS